ncbi:TIGR00730 family Rossman fold protein [Candidatus Babeliales bacterium]|nr:TIGR00730 family Rossman fold protein [Candidatus Babeliales bacterium]MCF7899575.1 TIGR00730 family Rossman fold protein [Candidatus Babeliales bacterium]
MLIKRIKEYLKFLKSWSLTSARVLWGMWKLTKLPQPAITIFGGNGAKVESDDSNKAYDLAKKLTLNGYSVITGGGYGIMRAANKGSYEAAKEMGFLNGGDYKKMTSLGITLTCFSHENLNPYLHEKLFMRHFFSRKLLLVRYSIGFIIFPGGFGTMDELFEIITLEQCSRMPQMPIILINKSYWGPIIDWLEGTALKQNFIQEKHLDIISVTDSVKEAFNIIEKYCKNKTDPKNLLYEK